MKPRRPPFRDADGRIVGRAGRDGTDEDETDPDDAEPRAGAPETTPEMAARLRAARNGLLVATRWFLGLLLALIAVGFALRLLGCSADGAP